MSAVCLQQLHLYESIALVKQLVDKKTHKKDAQIFYSPESIFEDLTKYYTAVCKLVYEILLIQSDNLPVSFSKDVEQ